MKKVPSIGSTNPRMVNRKPLPRPMRQPKPVSDKGSKVLSSQENISFGATGYTKEDYE